VLPGFPVGAVSEADSAIPATHRIQQLQGLQTIQQLGLKLQPRKTPVDTIVIDHLEKNPIEN
jgi:uncharacterized protein (TIGR03435 family)